jgi:stress-induced morphogen
MPIEARDIEALIRDAFPNARISVQGDDGAHFAAEVIDESRSRVEPRPAAARGLCRAEGQDGRPARGELHALALTTKAPE